MRYTLITLTISCLSIVFLGCQKESSDSTTPDNNFRSKNIFGLPVNDESCKINKLLRKTPYGNDTSFFQYNSTNLVEKISEGGATTTFSYNTSGQLVKVSEVFDGYAPDDWTFEYDLSAGKVKSFYHIYEFDNMNEFARDTFSVTYPSANVIVISVNDPYSDSLFRDSVVLNENYNPLKLTRIKESKTNGNHITLMSVSYTYSNSTLNPLTAEASVAQWIEGLYTDMRYFLQDPIAFDHWFTFYYDQIIPFGKYLQQSHTYSSVGVIGSWQASTGDITNNANGFPLLLTNSAQEMDSVLS